jgi:hypothetical protein
MAAFIVVLACGCSSDDTASEAGPTTTQSEDPVQVTIDGPVAGGKGVSFSTSRSLVDLDANGYSEKEYFYRGEATAYDVPGGMTMDGKWTLTESTKAPYKTRLVVRRPKNAAKFNGVVIVEWYNVTGGIDADPGFMYNWEELLREGYAWVGVSAQASGIQGGGLSFGLLFGAPPPLKDWDTARYGSLSHPGDAYSYDIFTRAGQIVRGAGEVDVLEGLKPKRLIAYGESQSAGRLTSYVNGVHPLVKVYDGFFIHSRNGSSASFADGATMGFGGGAATAVQIRDDIKAPVFQFQTETDVFGGFVQARQPDTDRLRTWEVAGTSHIDEHSVGNDEAAAAAGFGMVPCENVNNGPMHFVIKAAVHELNLWIADGTEPAKGAVLTAGANGGPMTDENGNTLGGVRTPHVDVPISTLSGQAPAGNLLCSLFGSTVPFTPEKLMELYPTHDDYVMKVDASARKALDARFMLKPEEQLMVAEAQAAAVPK